jgi:hypothetical protein
MTANTLAGLPDDSARSNVEAPCSKLQGIFEVKGSKEAQFPCCSHTPQLAAGYALAMHFQQVG